MEANEDFAGPEYGGEFINSSPGFSPTILLVTFPHMDWGAVLGLEPSSRFSANIGIFRGRGGLDDDLYGPMFMAVPALHFEDAGNPGALRLGFWWTGAKVTDFQTEEVIDSTTGWYALWDQQLWKENSGDEEDEQGIGVSFQYGMAPADRIEAEHFYGFSFQWAGAVPGRDSDVLGAGLYHVDFSDEAGFDEGSETVYEFFYKLQLLGWLSLKPDMQYIINPGGTTNDDALALGLRFEIAF